MSNPTETVSNGYDPSTGDFSTDPRRDNGAISPVICARHDLGDGECILCSPCAFRDSFAQAPLIIVETVKAEIFRTTTRSRYAVVPVSSRISFSKCPQSLQLRSDVNRSINISGPTGRDRFEELFLTRCVSIRKKYHSDLIPYDYYSYV